MSSSLQQAIAAHQDGNIEEAERLYRAILKAQPRQADALALLGVVIMTKGDADEALQWIEKALAIDPQSALFHFHHGNALMAAQKQPEAIAAFQRTIALQPNLAQAYYNLGNLLRSSGDWNAAAENYRKAVQCNPSYAEAWNNLALTLVHEKQYDEALAASKQSVTVAPHYGDGWLTLCNIAEQAKDYPLALEAGEQNIRLLPDNHRAWFGYGVALNRLDRNEEAIIAYKRALELNPQRADIWDNLGQTYQSLNWLADAEVAFRKTIEVSGQLIRDEAQRNAAGQEIPEEEYGNRHWHLGLLQLLRGDYTEGFARYRSRFKDIGGLSRPKFSRPLWKGEDMNGKTLLVCDEQGFGDTLMLARYLPLLKARGVKIIFSVHPVLEPLFEGWSGIDILITHGTAVPAYDTYCSVFDLPHRFGTLVDTIPNNVPYLPVLVPDEATHIAGDGRMKVGVVWGGNPLHANDMRRSAPLAVFSRVFAETGAQFFSLNRDLKKGDAELLPSFAVTDLIPRLKNFADAARIIGQMDLIITVDTATAHLAGGLGKPVWVMLPFAPDWRWLSDREDSVWYPTARLFRQKKTGDWDDVIARVKTALSDWIASRG